ncbi:MAG: hypothetical protein PVF47_06795 [Anaerolineae bacterium]|jgi:hypothetical protein
MSIRVYDWQGNERTMAYITDKYGNFEIKEAAAGDGPAFKIVALREKVNTAATLVVRVSDASGVPLEGVRVAWYWSDAPQDPNAGPLGGALPQMVVGRAVNGLTNLNGDVGFGMGKGAYYWPAQGQIGPHAVWVHGSAVRSDLLFGLGMIGATNHDHFDVEFARVETSGEGPSDEIPVAEIKAQLETIEAALVKIRQLLT